VRKGWPATGSLTPVAALFAAARPGTKYGQIPQSPPIYDHMVIVYNKNDRIGRKLIVKTTDRHLKIVELVHRMTKVTVDELSVELGASRETIRRDLAVLSQQGLLRKIHGGATSPVTNQSAKESPLNDRRATQRAEKIRIAKTAVQFFNPGDSLLINCGTTTIFFAEQLAKRGPFTTITNATFIAQEMWNSPDRGQVHLLGGTYFGDAFETVGPQVIEQIQKVSADHAVIGVGGISDSGVFMDYTMDEAYISRAMIDCARHVTVLADSSKFYKNALFHVCKPDRISRLVIDKPPDETVGRLLKSAGVEIIIAADTGNNGLS
jgi:DeoR family transcriptional regulator, glycerol-3-phosphate regulon repressor